MEATDKNTVMKLFDKMLDVLRSDKPSKAQAAGPGDYDPFGSEIADFLKEKEQKALAPKEEIEPTPLEPEVQQLSEDMGEKVEQDSPQEVLETKVEHKTGDEATNTEDVQKPDDMVEDLAEEATEGDEEEAEESKKAEEGEKAAEEGEKAAEEGEKAEAKYSAGVTATMEVIRELMDKGDYSLAVQIMGAMNKATSTAADAQTVNKTSPEVIKMLQELLEREYQQRDVYETYDYLLFGPEAIGVQEELRDHIDEEMEHIRTLQRYLVAFGAIPTSIRLEIPTPKVMSLEGVMALDLELELEAVERYTKAIKHLEETESETALRVDLENILVMEQEHTHDLQQWLRRYGAVVSE